MEKGYLYNLFPGEFKAQLGKFESATFKIPEMTCRVAALFHIIGLNV